MDQTITITPKWQVHIPVAVRKILNLTRPTRVTVTVRNKAIVMRPHTNTLLKSAGSLATYAKKKKHIDLGHIRDHIDYSQL